MKRKPEDLTPDDQVFTRKLLMDAARTAHKNGSIEEFLEGLLTPSEQIMLGRRIWIARMLLAGDNFDQIGARLHVGPGTITTVELWLLGLLPDYGKEIKVLRRKAIKQKRDNYAKQHPFSLTALKKKYPLHFLLIPWPKI